MRLFEQLPERQVGASVPALESRELWLIHIDILPIDGLGRLIEADGEGRTVSQGMSLND